jgi:hypothetical protein
VHTLSRLLMDEPRSVEPPRRLPPPAVPASGLSGLPAMGWHPAGQTHPQSQPQDPPFLARGSPRVPTGGNIPTAVSSPVSPPPVNATAWLPRSASTAAPAAPVSNPTATTAVTQSHSARSSGAAGGPWIQQQQQHLVPGPAACFLCSDLGVCGAEALHAAELCPRRAVLRRMAGLQTGAATSE